MIIETILIGSAALAARHGVQQRRAHNQAQEAWTRAMLTSKQINAQVSRARRVMLDEVRRQQRQQQRADQ